METDYWISELGRLFKRSTEAVEEGYVNAAGKLTSEFNELLEQLKEEFPGNDIIDNTEPVEASTDFGPRSQSALHDVRSNCERIASAIGYELPQVDRNTHTSDQMIMVEVDSSQETNQAVHQEVTVESIQNLIQSMPRSQRQKEELEEIISEFQDEIEGDQDQGKLRQLLSRAGEISKDVASQMGTFALERGVIAILGL